MNALVGQTVVVIGGSSGIGLETARRARHEGASIVLVARDADGLKRAGLELGARTAAFDATDFARLRKVESQVGEGSTFTFTVPVRRGEWDPYAIPAQCHSLAAPCAVRGNA